MRLTRRGKALCDDAALVVTGVIRHICRRRNQMTGLPHDGQGRCIREVPEQVHSGQVQLNVVLAVCAREIETERVSDVAVADLDAPAVELRAASCAGYGYTQDVLSEPIVGRCFDLQAVQLGIRNRNINVFVSVGQIDDISGNLFTAFCKCFRLCSQGRKCGRHAQKAGILYGRIAAEICFSRAVIYGTV